MDLYKLLIFLIIIFECLCDIDFFNVKNLDTDSID